LSSSLAYGVPLEPAPPKHKVLSKKNNFKANIVFRENNLNEKRN
jgi:hypothetical protein